MTDDKIVAKVTSFLSRELIKNMGDVAIFKNKNGSNTTKPGEFHTSTECWEE